MKQTRLPQRRRRSRLLSWIIRFSDRRQIHGLQVAVLEKDPKSVEAVFGKIGEALGLVRHHDARAFNELVSHTRGVFVFGTTGGDAAEWWRDEGLVVMQPEYASDANASPLALAVILVHEATHAWLERRGFEYAVDRRARLERICDRRALRLARRLPDAEYLVSWLQQEQRPREHLADEAFHQRAVAELLRLGAPLWFVRQMDLWSKRWYRLTPACSGRPYRAAPEPPRR